jgi:hypothetical protein
MGKKFIWVRNRNAAGRGSDPMPQLIHEDVGIAHLEIVAEHVIPALFANPSIHALAEIYPAPKVTS